MCAIPLQSQQRCPNPCVPFRTQSPSSHKRFDPCANCHDVARKTSSCRQRSSLVSWRCCAAENTPAKTKPSSSGAEEEERQRKRQLEDELRDPKNFLEYFLPRPLRLAFFLASALSCSIACLLNIAAIVQEPDALKQLTGSTAGDNLVVNLIGVATFGSLYVWDERQAQARVERRKKVRAAQIAIGDREVYVNAEGEKMSRLKEVNDEWILRRLERWGRKDGMPFVGPAKGKILQQLVRERAPMAAVEVGSLCGYSAILLAQAMPREGKLISLEKDWKWVLVAKRFLWQASQGGRDTSGIGRIADVWWGDAQTLMPRAASALPGGKIELLFLDGLPKEYLGYLQAAEPVLKPGALVIADNAGIFAEGGLKPYLAYVRNNSAYNSSYVVSTLEWRDDVPDGMEISIYKGNAVASHST